MDVKVEVMVPEGLKAVGDVLLAVAADVKAGKSPMQMLADAEPAIVAAVSKFGELSADLQDPQVYEFAGLFAAQLIQVLMAKVPAVPAA